MYPIIKCSITPPSLIIYSIAYFSTISLPLLEGVTNVPLSSAGPMGEKMLQCLVDIKKEFSRLHRTDLIKSSKQSEGRGTGQGEGQGQGEEEEESRANVNGKLSSDSPTHSFTCSLSH